MKIKQSTLASFLVMFVVYALATVLGIVLFEAFDMHYAWALLLADVIATVFVFAFSLIFKNASVYDPYWSVQPIVIVVYAAVKHCNGVNLATAMMIVGVCVWGLRLTANWAINFGNLTRQDWRYTMLAEKTKKAYPIINFVGIHMVPTLVVYGATMPVVVAFNSITDKANAFVFVGLAVTLVATALELVADIQMKRYRNARTTPFCRVGLWKYSRHPNYLGEILFWWGVAVMAVAVMPSKWYLFAGAFANTLLFAFVSIPMAEKRQGRKEGFDEYKKQTHLLLPFKK